MCISATIHLAKGWKWGSGLLSFWGPRSQLRFVLHCDSFLLSLVALANHLLSGGGGSALTLKREGPSNKVKMQMSLFCTLCLDRTKVDASHVNCWASLLTPNSIKWKRQSLFFPTTNYRDAFAFTFAIPCCLESIFPPPCYGPHSPDAMSASGQNTS